MTRGFEALTSSFIAGRVVGGALRERPGSRGGAPGLPGGFRPRQGPDASCVADRSGVGECGLSSLRRDGLCPGSVGRSGLAVRRPRSGRSVSAGPGVVGRFRAASGAAARRDPRTGTDHPHPHDRRSPLGRGHSDDAGGVARRAHRGAVDRWTGVVEDRRPGGRGDGVGELPGFVGLPTGACAGRQTPGSHREDASGPPRTPADQGSRPAPSRAAWSTPACADHHRCARHCPAAPAPACSSARRPYPSRATRAGGVSAAVTTSAAAASRPRPGRGRVGRRRAGRWWAGWWWSGRGGTARARAAAPPGTRGRPRR